VELAISDKGFSLKSGNRGKISESCLGLKKKSFRFFAGFKTFYSRGCLESDYSGDFGHLLQKIPTTHPKIFKVLWSPPIPPPLKTTLWVADLQFH
jgi:hypothetical protein